MNEDLWIFVCTHGRFGEELVKSAEMIAGEVNNVYSFPLVSGMPPEEYKEIMMEKLKQAPADVLCLVDLFGGTPCTTCTILSKKYNMHVLTGLNLAMYIEITSLKSQRSVDELLEIGLQTLNESGKNVIKLLSDVRRK